VALGFPDYNLATNGGVVSVEISWVDVNEVTYGTGGRWGQWAHGGGSSLELIDPRNPMPWAPNWADSDETHKSGWVTLEHTGVLDNGNDAAYALQIVTLGAGEYLVGALCHHQLRHPGGGPDSGIHQGNRHQGDSLRCL
jgi:hypothetical protein